LQVTVVSPERAASARSAHGGPCAAGNAFRAVPLLSCFNCRDGRLVAIGQIRILVRADGPADVEVVVRALWHLPVGLAGLFASIVAALLPAERRRRLFRFGATLAATVIIVVTLAYAGGLVDPEKPDTGTNVKPTPARSG
jgi:hypothetical protein